MSLKSILVVGDEPVVALDIQMTLERAGYRVVGTASTGERAIEIVEASHPDLVLMDIHLDGEMDGIEAAGHIAERFDVPEVYLTANSDPGTVGRAVAGAPFGYVVKPFDARVLKTTIDIALRRHADEQSHLIEARQELDERTQELAFLSQSLEEATARLEENDGLRQEVGEKLAAMVMSVSAVVTMVKARANAANAVMLGDADSLAEQVAGMVAAMTQVIAMVQSRMLPAAHRGNA